MAAVKKPGPIDPLTGPKQALAGRVVTMDDAFTVRPDGIVYIDQGCIVAVQDRAQPAPAGFAGVPVVETGGTLFPGLIELHNHLSYNALPLVVAGAEALPAPRPVVHPQGLPSHDQRAHDGDRRTSGRGRPGRRFFRPWCATSSASACSAASPPARESCSPATPASSASTVGSYATSSRPTIRPLPEAQGRIADVDAKDAQQVPDAAQEGR